MGMYTELVIGCALLEPTQDKVKIVLDYMFNGDHNNEPQEVVEIFGKNSRARLLVSCSSCYFQYHESHSHYDIEKGIFCIRSSLKNYDSEVEKFLNWLAPYVENGHIGHSRYEEDDYPVIYFIDDGKLISKQLK